MPKYNVPFTIEGEVEVIADTEAHAQQIVDRMSQREWSDHGTLKSWPPEYVRPDHDGERADHQRATQENWQ